MIKQLSYPGFIDPRFTNALPVHGEVKDGKVVAGDTILLFVDMPYREGIAVKVFLHNRNFACQSLAEIETERIEREQRQIDYQEELRIKHAQEQAEAIRFNESLNIPVKWRPEVKRVLSGLLEDSNGNGWRSNTVVHVMLDEPLRSGRLHREAYQPLCSGDMGSFGDLISTIDHYNQAKNPQVLKVTCKGCLKIAGRWKKEGSNGHL